MKAIGIICVIVGIIILIVAFSAMNSQNVSSTSSQSSGNTPEVQDTPIFNVSLSDAKNMVISYYDNQGEWAGQYVISNIESLTYPTSSDNYVIACVVYDYTPLPSNSGASSGTDQRTFEFDYTGTGWQVVSMGDHMSC